MKTGKATWRKTRDGLFSREAADAGFTVAVSLARSGDFSPGSGDFLRNSWLQELGIAPSVIAAGRQVHGTGCFQQNGIAPCEADAETMHPLIPDCDALVNAPGFGAGVFSADCVPLFLMDPHSGYSAAVHSGWKGTKAQIVLTVLKKLSEAGACLHHLVAVFGPSIKPCCYPVGSDFRNWAPADSLSVSGDKLRFDNQWTVAMDLAAFGILPQNMYLNNFCTACHHHDFFSWRKQGPAAGRLFSIIIKNKKTL